MACTGTFSTRPSVPTGRVIFEVGGVPIREEIAREGPSWIFPAFVSTEYLCSAAPRRRKIANDVRVYKSSSTTAVRKYADRAPLAVNSSHSRYYSRVSSGIVAGFARLLQIIMDRPCDTSRARLACEYLFPMSEKVTCTQHSGTPSLLGTVVPRAVVLQKPHEASVATCVCHGAPKGYLGV